MKKVILCLALFASSLATKAQITLTAADFTSTVAGATDTLKRIVISTMPALTKGADQVWDFSGVTLDSTIYLNHCSVPAGAFSTTAQYGDTISDYIGYYYTCSKTVMSGVNSFGITAYGASIPKQTQWISPTAGTDSFTLLRQDDVYSSHEYSVLFPVTYHSHWFVSDSAIINSIFSIASLGYVDNPGSIHVIRQIVDSVVGWGKLRLNNSSGALSEVNVLMVSSSILEWQNTFFHDTMITMAQSTATGLPNLSSWAEWAAYKFYMANSVTPVLSVVENPTFSTSYFAYILSKNLPPLETNQLNLQTDIKVYPNPASNLLSIDCNTENQAFKLVDVCGRMLISGILQAGSNTIEVSTLPAGVYTLPDE